MEFQQSLQLLRYSQTPSSPPELPTSKPADLQKQSRDAQQILKQRGYLD
jgi:hypothetical protein